MLVNGSLAVGILASLRFRITCFSAVGITNSRFFFSAELQIRLNGSILNALFVVIQMTASKIVSYRYLKIKRVFVI